MAFYLQILHVILSEMKHFIPQSWVIYMDFVLLHEPYKQFRCVLRKSVHATETLDGYSSLYEYFAFFSPFSTRPTFFYTCSVFFLRLPVLIFPSTALPFVWFEMFLSKWTLFVRNIITNAHTQNFLMSSLEQTHLILISWCFVLFLFHCCICEVVTAVMSFLQHVYSIWVDIFVPFRKM